MNKNGTLIENENPAESEYYKNIGRINLYDLTVFAGKKETDFHNIFATIPTQQDKPPQKKE